MALIRDRGKCPLPPPVGLRLSAHRATAQDQLRVLCRAGDTSSAIVVGLLILHDEIEGLALASSIKALDLHLVADIAGRKDNHFHLPLHVIRDISEQRR